MLNKITDLGISKREAEELLKVSEDIEKDYNLLKDNYPIQYLIGYVNFYGYKILVNENVLIPRFETELLVEEAIKIINRFNNPKVLDIGTGSGAIAIAVKKETNSNVDASDISIKALDVAKKNALINDVNINFIQSNALDNIDGKYDIIISNPPYISYDEEVMECVKKYEPHLALYADDDGLYFYKKIIKDSIKVLNKKFVILFEIGYKQAETISKIAKKVYPNSKITIIKDYSDKDRILIIENE